MELHHLTAEQLGEMAATAGAKTLAAVHLTSDATTETEIARFRDRIAARFADGIRIGEDGACY